MDGGAGDDSAAWVRLIDLDPEQVYSVSLQYRGVGLEPETGPTISLAGTTNRIENNWGDDAWYSEGVTVVGGEGLEALSLGVVNTAGNLYFDDVSIARHVNTTSEHIVFSHEAALAADIAPAALQSWLNNLDLVYESYAELVGATPFDGVPIEIRTVRQFPGGWAVAGNPIRWLAPYVPETLEDIETKGDWSFGILHEIGHDYDLDNRWNWDAEFWANLKMVYVLQDLNARGIPAGVLTAPLGQPEALHQGDILNFYEVNDAYCAVRQSTLTVSTGDACDPTTDENVYDDCYDCICSDSGQWDCSYKYGGRITKHYGDMVGDHGWGPWKATFRYFNSLTEEQFEQLLEARTAQGENERFARFSLFMNRLSQELGTESRGYFGQAELDYIEFFETVY